MFLNILLFILVFSLVFILTLFCMIKKELVKENLYLIIPSICIGLWALYFIVIQVEIHSKLIISQPDFSIIYKCGNQIWTDPADLYKRPFYYLPIWAIVLALTVCLFPFYIASFIFYGFTYILGVLSIREYNKILILKDIGRKFHRFMFLMIISNGFTVFIIFFFGQFKYIILVIFLFVIRRELQYRNNELEKDFKYKLINYSLLAFAIAIFPFFILLLLVYIFQEIPFNELFKKENLKEYVIVIFVFALENFLFFIYPSLIFEFFGLYQKHNKREWKDSQLPNFYLAWINLDDYSLYFIISTIIMVCITFILISLKNNNLKIEDKFGYFSLAVIFISIYARRLFLVLFPFAFLLFIPFFNQDEKSIEFLKKNKFFLIGLLSGFAIYFMDPHHGLIELFFPALEGSKLLEYKWIAFVSIFGVDILILHLKKYNFLHKQRIVHYK